MPQETPRPTNLYRRLAKDYSPKQAEMAICKYVEGLEARIAALEEAADERAEQSEKKATRAAKTPKSETPPPSPATSEETE